MSSKKASRIVGSTKTKTDKRRKAKDEEEDDAPAAAEVAEADVDVETDAPAADSDPATDEAGSNAGSDDDDDDDDEGDEEGGQMGQRRSLAHIDPSRQVAVFSIRDATEDDLRDYFGRFGKVEDVTIARYQNSNRSKGYGFVMFSDANVRNKVLTRRHQMTLGDEAIDINVSEAYAPKKHHANGTHEKSARPQNNEGERRARAETTSHAPAKNLRATHSAPAAAHAKGAKMSERARLSQILLQMSSLMIEAQQIIAHIDG